VPNTQLASCVRPRLLPTANRIELPRPAIVAALGVLVLAITFLVTKAGDDAGSVSVPAPAATTTTETSATGTDTTTNTGTGTTTTETTAKPAQPDVKAGPGLPSDVARALNDNKVVVLFFYDRAASDDQATAAAVRAVRSSGGGRVRLFQDVVARISDYRRVVSSLGISQSPALVVIDRNRKAQLFEGYLDAGTIRQTVRDAL
jgi:hypothetical protein